MLPTFIRTLSPNTQINLAFALRVCLTQDGIARVFLQGGHMETVALEEISPYLSKNTEPHAHPELVSVVEVTADRFFCKIDCPVDEAERRLDAAREVLQPVVAENLETVPMAAPSLSVLKPRPVLAAPGGQCG